MSDRSIGKRNIMEVVRFYIGFICQNHTKTTTKILNLHRITINSSHLLIAQFNEHFAKIMEIILYSSIESNVGFFVSYQTIVQSMYDVMVHRHTS